MKSLSLFRNIPFLLLSVSLFFFPLTQAEAPIYRTRPGCYVRKECMPNGCAYQDASQAVRLVPAVTIGLIVVVVVIAIALANRSGSHH